MGWHVPGLVGGLRAHVFAQFWFNLSSPCTHTDRESIDLNRGPNALSHSLLYIAKKNRSSTFINMIISKL